MARSRAYFVYILVSNSGVLYVGSTRDLARRTYQHRHGLLQGFTKQYNVNRLVWWDVTPTREQRWKWNARSSAGGGRRRCN